MDAEWFGRQLITTLDLDPVYVALYNAQWSEGKVCRWLTAYWCFYDCGVACYMADAYKPDEYWARMRTAARNKLPAPHGERWRRASERRHFRGRLAVDAVDELAVTYSADPTQMVRYCGYGPVADVMRRVASHRGFGPWIAFKAADMIERVLGWPVDFDGVDLFDSPREGAALAAPGLVLEEVCHLLQESYRDLAAPPRFDRSPNIQEVETVLCKWKSHLGGSYEVGKDIQEVRHHMKPWLLYSPSARDFYAFIPPDC